jgi:uncharacterized membrane protein
MKRFLFLVVLILSLSFNVAFVSHLITDQENHKSSVVRHKSLDLSKEQSKKIHKDTLALGQKNLELKKEVQKCRKDLLSLLSGTEVDKDKLRLCIEKISTLQKKIQANTIKKLLIYKKHLSHNQCKCMFECLGVEMNLKPFSCKKKYCPQEKK